MNEILSAGVFLFTIFMSGVLVTWISRRRQAAELDSQAFLSEILDNAVEAIILIDKQQRILMFNQGAESVFGYFAHEVLGQPIELVIPQRFQTTHHQHVSAFGRSQEVSRAIWQHNEVCGVRKGGEEFPAESSIAKHRLNGRDVYSVFLRDISARKQREMALQESEARFQQLFDRSPVGIFIVDLDGRFIQANAAYKAFTGYGEAELAGINYWELIHPEDREATQDMFTELTQGERFFYEKESRYLRKDGNIVWGAKIVTILRSADGKSKGLFGQVKDITMRKRAEADLEEYHKHLEELVARRTAELEKSRSRLAILNQASRVVNSASLNPDHIFVAIHQMTAWMMPVDVFEIALVDESRDDLEVLYLAGREGRQPARHRPLQGSCVEWMLTNHRSLRVDDLSSSEQKPIIVNQEDGIRSMLSVLLQSGSRVMGALCLKSSQPGAYTPDDQKALESFAAHAAIAIENTRLYQQAQETAVSEERHRLARELHDSVTQLLYSMSLLSSGWKKMAQDGRLADPAASFEQLEDIGLQALKEMRLLIHQLRSSILEEAGLAGALRQRLEAVEQHVNVDTELVVDGDLPALPYMVEEQLYHIAQEALNNTLRHARATAISVHIRCQDGRLSLVIRDNGVGFNPDKSSTGLGLNSMQERAEAISAKLQIASEPGYGMTVQVTIAV